MTNAALGGEQAGAEPDDRRLLRESAQAFAAKELRPARLRELRGLPAQFDRGLWRQMAELGWPGLMLPEAYGGFGLGLADMAAVLQELGRPLLPEPLVASAVFAGGLIAAGDNEALKGKLLPALCEGSLVPTVAWQEGLRAFPFGAAGAVTRATSGTHAVLAAGGWVLNGEKTFVRPVSGTDGFIVTACADDGLGLFWIPGAIVDTGGGLSVRSEKSTDVSDVGRIELRDVKVAAENVIATPRAGQAAFDRVFDQTLIASSAELLGLIRGALDMTLGYLRTRVQFGKAIGSFQALQHRAVDLYIQQELSAAALKEVIERFEQLGTDAAAVKERAALSSRIKARCSDAALQVTREAIQMHGAIGFTDEYDIGFYLKRALALSAWLGNSAEHRQRYARCTFKVAA